MGKCAQAILLAVYLLNVLRCVVPEQAPCVKPTSNVLSQSSSKVTQSSTLNRDETNGPERAIDEDPSTCSRTSNEQQSWWEVDLGRNINVTLVKITNSEEKSVTLVIDVSLLDGRFSAKCGHKHVLGAGETRVIRCKYPIRGRILRIRPCTEETSLTLCEVQVFDNYDMFTKGITYMAWYDIPHENLTKSKYSLLSSFYDYREREKSDSEGIFPYFDTPRNIADHYGLQIDTFYNAPETGYYTFYMSGDDHCRLFLENTTRGNDIKEIAHIPRSDDVPHWTSYNQWNESVSLPKFLRRNIVYKIIALQKEGTGPDHLRVGVRLPSGVYERPMISHLYTSLAAAQAGAQDECGNGSMTTTTPFVKYDNVEKALNYFQRNTTRDVDKLSILNKIEKLGLQRAKTLELGNKSSVSIVMKKDDVVFAAIALDMDKFTGFACPGSLPSSDLFNGGNVVFPETLFANSTGRVAYLVCMAYSPLQLMRQQTASTDNSLGNNILSAIIDPDIKEELQDPVILYFNNTANQNKTKGKCVFWIEDESLENRTRYGRWSTKGCALVHQNDSHVVCACNHLTKFAVLFSGSEVSGGDEEKIEFITYVGLALSSIGCFLTFLTYLVLRINKSLKNVIHLNLVVALGSADVVFLLANLVEHIKTLCFVATLLTFYLYLAVFGWMFIEGIHLYFLVIRVFGRNNSLRRKLYFFVGWGVPLLFVVVTAALMGKDLMSRKHCWLSVENRAIWAFIGPVILVIIINIVILFGVLRTTLTVLQHDPGYRKEKSAIRTLAMLVPILGVTWLFGVLIFVHDTITIQYVFALLNAFQGFIIFILYCLLNSEVRQEYDRKLKAWKTGREIETKRSKQNNSLI